MAHYRKIDTRITLDRKFNALPKDSKLLFFHLLTHRHLTSLGAMHITLPGLACELDFTREEFAFAFDALCQQSMVYYDHKACLLWLPNFLKYNAPESPNAVRAWESALSYLPECDLRDALIIHVKAFVQSLPATFQEALPEVFQLACSTAEPVTVLPTQSLKNNPSPTLREDLPQVLPIQEQEQEQELKNKNKDLKQEQEEKEIVEENNIEEKNNIGEEKNIVAPARQKTLTSPHAKASEVLQVFACWQETLGHLQARLDDKRRKVIKNALALGYTVIQLQNAIRGCSLTPHNMGENEQGQRYDGLQVILRDADQIDRFIRNSHSPPRLRNAADRLLASNVAAGERWLAMTEDIDE